MLGSPEVGEGERQRLTFKGREILDLESRVRLEVRSWRTDHVALALILSPVVVPGLVSVRRPLPSIFQNSVDHRFADQDAQIHDKKGIHRPAGTDRGNKTWTTLKKQLLKDDKSGPKHDNEEKAVVIIIILFYCGALLRFRLVIKRHLGLHTSVDCYS